MIFIFSLFSDHFCPALGTGDVHAALTDRVRDLVVAFGANAIAAGSRAGLGAAAATASAATLSASTAQGLIAHFFISFRVFI